MAQKTFSQRCAAASMLPVFALVGCAPHIQQTAAVPKKITSDTEQSATRLPTRAIIHFQQQTADSQVLAAAISAACNCQAVFFRAYLGDALIYTIELPTGQPFAAFAERLMQRAAQFGIREVEQDSVMRHQ